MEGRSYTPVDNVVSAADPSRLQTVLTSPIPNLQMRNRSRLLDDSNVSRETLVNCSNYITTDLKYSKGYLERNIELENMEFYAVLKVAQKFGIPAGGVFVVTNYCDADAHEAFKKNHREAMLKLTEYMNQKNKELSL